MLVQGDQVDALEIELADVTGELQRELIALPPLAVVGEVFDGGDDQSEELVDQRVSPKLVPVGGSADRDIVGEQRAETGQVPLGNDAVPFDPELVDSARHGHSSPAVTRV